MKRRPTRATRTDTLFPDTTSARSVATIKKVQAEEERIVEVETYMRSKPLVSALLRRLGESLPANVAIDSIDLRDAGLVLRFSVRGAPETAAGYATAYR